MAIKTCSNCNQTRNRMKHLKDFPEEFVFCNIKCIFQWFQKHDFKVNGNMPDMISNKKITAYAEDYLTP